MATEYGYGYGSGDGERRRRVPAGLRAPFEARGWRELGYVLLGLPIGILLFTYAVTMVSVGAGLLITFLGVPVLAAGLAGCRGFGALERARARALLGVDVAAPEPLRPRGRGALAWMGAVLRSGASWRQLLYAVVQFPWSVFSFVVAVTFWTYGWAALTYPLWFWVFPVWVGQDGLQLYGDETHSVYLDNPFEVTVTALVGLLFTMATPWIVRGLTMVDRGMVVTLLGPSRLGARVVELESDRGVVVDTAAADLRRIERDLHDGAQARLVALAMDLGLAKEKLAEDPRAAAVMVDSAHGEVKTALQELRDLARGIHPAVLTDRGLDAALSSVASRCAVPVVVEVDLPARPVPAIEGIAYFTVSELLQNVSKHARATRATVDVWKVENRLMLQVIDDGVGGADTGRGSGLAGLAGRIGAVDGILVVDSPAGGPTRVTAELPWRAV
ncbi:MULTISPECIES: sensor histidine kinase [Streptomyces]|uniref:histidine kinase n=1 Tax=Streptomyces caniscabiei TaxID=2746961 RepID=A0ABU4MJL0_9ACTN|nr:MULTISPECIES: sensor histidine kinase [Streptomyces]MBE4736962.1 sensor domain-containing protein [Streptomyces caniscabiei]MBE4757802.1 sensor domain-containing protein [Streptomyces caniscabiei]MBE4770806.1 sensor domain-containing protein [Streptomyces caniscabiei]MBE4786921.1 sensor domain-containing protein [Streptomyces caniscabiei]MBE4794825.1 sensor domain-containing protein [Streptomyces caniscabiei]